MYFSEWGIKINNTESLVYAINLINLHNSSFTDPSKRIIAYSVFDYDGNIYMTVGNGGNSLLSTAFLSTNNDGLEIYYPLKKPSWWNNEFGKEYLWSPDRSLPDCSLFPSSDIFDL